MTLELYFALSLVFFVSVNAVAKAEQYVEDSFLTKSKMIDSVFGLLKRNLAKVYHHDDEFYCFFKKDAFDIC
ncbi:hypothetical protein [Maridesulfovibrio sp.]|uniref:hypothetical protein n=1 Tax=Maridesulfovibrio sp. TaxID=2795000 RepID=UPI0029F49CAC|nr:hypothetical protein [Maridesulfovibrio sp.]